MQNIEILYDERLLVGESPVWNEKRGELIFVDIRGKCLFRMNWSTGKCQKTELSQMVGCTALCENDDLLVSMEDGVYRLSPDGNIRLAHDPMKLKGERFNDGKVAPDGYYYVGTAGANFSGAFYRLGRDGLVELFDGCGCSNGLDWNSDGSVMYYCDSRRQKIERFDFDKVAHSLSSRKTICDIPLSIGSGDGMCVDSEGKLWLAVWGGSRVERIDPESGAILTSIELPASQVSSCCFAGDDLRDMVITTAAVRTEIEREPLAGRVFCVRVDVPGVKFNRYKF